jgi:hypothetical protein
LQGVFNTPDPIDQQLLSLFNSTNGVLVAAVASTFGEWTSMLSASCIALVLTNVTVSKEFTFLVHSYIGG